MRDKAIVRIRHGTYASADAYDVDLDTVHLTRLDNCNGRREAGVIHHSGLVLPDSDLREIDGRRYVKPARAIAETCTQSSIESGMVTASSLLRPEVCTQDELLELAGELERWRGIRRARIACQLSDNRFESVGEVRSFHMCWRWNLPKPELQFDVFDSNGQFLGRTDFAWLEFRHVASSTAW